MSDAMTEEAKKSKKARYQSRKVKFGSKELTLWSLDGCTWSSRRDELMVIQERHEAERLKLMQGVAERVEEDVAAKRDGDASPDAAAVSEEDGPVLVTGSEEGDEKPVKKDSKKKIVSKKDRVQFVAPKPRQIAKAKNKPMPKSKKKAA